LLPASLLFFLAFLLPFLHCFITTTIHLPPKGKELHLCDETGKRYDGPKGEAYDTDVSLAETKHRRLEVVLIES
jgi:hypothetical protein